jgi:hypothetical protein
MARVGSQRHGKKQKNPVFIKVIFFLVALEKNG